MEDNAIQMKSNYIKILSLLYLQKIEMEQMIENSIKYNNKPLLCCLINRDIIDNHQKLYLYHTISNFIDNLKKKNQSYNFDFFKGEKCMDFYNLGIDDEKLLSDTNSLPDLPIFFETEKLKIQGYEYPYNFYILRKEILDLLLGQNENINNNMLQSNCTKIYNVLIGREGIFIWNKEKQKEYIAIYYLDGFSSEINKIYLYKKEEEFFDELKKNIIGKTKRDYFRFRKIKDKDTGFYNLIDDGKIIFKYINIVQSGKFREDESVDLKAKFDNIIEETEEKTKKIESFLESLLINFFYIKDIRIIPNDNKNKGQNDEKSLLDSFSEFVSETIDISGNNIKFDININIKEKLRNFKKILFDNNLGENIVFDEEHENRGYENLIEKIISTFKNDMKIKNVNMPNIIEELFYGKKNVEGNYYEYFNTLYINQKKLIPENTNIFNLYEIKQSFEDSDICKLPEILIL